MEKELISILDNKDSNKKYRYILIDKLVSVSDVNILHIDSIIELLGIEALNTILRPDLSHDINHCPVLVTLAKPGENINEMILHGTILQTKKDYMLNKRYICFWAVSELEPSDMVESIITIGKKLSKILDSKFFPFYEPFKIQLLHDANKISSDWLPNMLSCFETYCYTSFFTNDMRSIHSLSYKPSLSDLFITEETKSYLRQSNNLYYLSQAWSNLCEKHKQQVNDADLLQLISYYYQGLRYGLINTESLFYFSLKMMSDRDKLTDNQTKIKDTLNRIHNNLL